MTLPPGYQFSQSSLQDYLDCRRRFYLRHIQHVSWPAPESEPILENERFLRQGERFHNLVQQFFSGIPVETLSSQAMDVDLAGWWRNFLAVIPGLLVFSPESLPLPGLAAEKLLAFTSGGYRVVARYDLLAQLPSRKLAILDWKTSRKRSSRDWLAGRVQTRLYPMVLALSGSEFYSQKTILPDQIEMLYWFSAYPHQPEKFEYSTAQLEQDREFILAVVEEIDSLEPDQFSLTPFLERCKFCIYRSLCDRGIMAGEFDDRFPDMISGETAESTLDFDQIGEIEF